MAAYYVVDALGNVTAFPVGVASADLSNLNASNLTSGTVPLARISGLTNTQIDAAAAIAWSKLSKSGSSLADLATRSAADLSSGNLPVARLGNGVTSTTTDTSTGTVNNWAPTITGDTYIAWSGASDATFTGLSSSGVTAGTIVIIKNTGSHVAYFVHQSASSSAGNKFLNTVTSGKTPVAAGGRIAFIFDGTQWVMFAHMQGAFITVPYSSGNFFGNVGTWTVESGDVNRQAYLLIGSMLVYQIDLRTTTVSGSPTQLRINLPDTYTTPGISRTGGRLNDNGTISTGEILALAAANTLIFFQHFDGSALAAATNATEVQGTILVELT